MDDDGTITKGKDFAYLKKQVLAADPKGVDSDDYTVTNKAAECPAISDDWQAASELPPTPNITLCECMAKSRTCVGAKNLSSKKYADIFDYICGEVPDACTAINGNSTVGNYGAYSMCTDLQKLDYVLDAYYKSQDSASTACDFDGSATTQDAADDSSCTDALKTADDHNDAIATATTAVGDSAATGSSDSSNSDDNEDFGIPGAVIARVFAFGDYAVGLYMVVAMGVGASMVVL